MDEFINKYGKETNKYYKNNKIVGVNSIKDDTDNNAYLLLKEYESNPNFRLDEPVSIDSAHYNPGKRNVGIDKGVSDNHRKEITEKYNENYELYFKTPSSGKGEGKQEEKKMVHCLKHVGTIGEVKIVDYEIPLCDRGTGEGKGNIDLVFYYGNDFYIIETKKLNSDESLLRCVLEIETYYESLNSNFSNNINYSNKINKGLLLDKNSTAYKHYFDGNHNNVKKLMKKYKIDLFELELINNKFNIKKVI